eukprot:COSAG02_NODE_61432_length_268_cov_1.136095_1_plen_29_part_10
MQHRVYSLSNALNIGYLLVAKYPTRIGSS